ncbi:MAG: beta-galactosidase, partial [Patescibacteria group bacterium]
RMILEAFESGTYFITAMYLLFAALSLGEASVVMMLVGAFTPLLTLVIGYPFGFAALGKLEVAGFAALVLGAFLMYGVEEKHSRRFVAVLSVLAALFFALSTITLKIVYLHTNFINGFIWTRLFGVLICLFLLLIPLFRKSVFDSAHTAHLKYKVFYFLNRGYASIASLLYAYAISIGNPALSEATGSFKFVVIFVAAWVLLKERFSGRVLWGKIGAMTLVSAGIIILVVSSLIAGIPGKKPQIFGATFAPFYAEKFGLDWQETYIAMLDDLGIRKLRLPAYWHEIEPEDDRFDFSRLDWQIDEAEKRGAEIILAVGYKLPRWPECHIPNWARGLSRADFEREVLEYIEATVKKYKNVEAIKSWQIENEPFLSFGDSCPGFSSKFLDKEIALVKSLDDRPVMITDSGELSIWIPAAKKADIFGSTLYRVIWNDRIGYFTYPIPPEFFRLKRAITEIFVGKKPMVIIELQGESWQKKMNYEISVEEQYKSMNPQAFQEVLSYIEGTGFDTFYLWGVEWWFWLKTTQNKPEMWDIAKEAIQKIK